MVFCYFCSRFHFLHCVFLFFTGLKKDLKKAAEKDSTGSVKDWSRGIVNHLYWVACSTPAADPNYKEIVEAKWLSLGDHIINKHTHSSEYYPKCLHGRRRKGDKKKKYLRKSMYLASF
jgi:hypothetical protein